MSTARESGLLLSARSSCINPEVLPGHGAFRSHAYHSRQSAVEIDQRTESQLIEGSEG